MSTSPLDGLLGLPLETWKVIGGAAGGMITAAAGAFAYIVRIQREFWIDRDRIQREFWIDREKIRKEELQDLVAQISKERVERTQRESELYEARRQIYELERSLTESIRQAVIKGEQIALSTIKDLEAINQHLRKQIEEMRSALKKLNEDNSESRREILTLSAGVELRDELLSDIEHQVTVLERGLTANKIIENKIDEAVLDEMKVSKLLALFKTRFADLRGTAIVRAERHLYETTRNERDVHRRNQEAQARARSIAKEENMQRDLRTTRRMNLPSNTTHKSINYPPDT